jgi:hypothetical protein
MTIRTRKFIGTLLLLALVAVWALLAMAAAQMVLPQVGGLGAAIYYAVVGVGWVLPAMPLISWMQRPDPDEHSTGWTAAEIRRHRRAGSGSRARSPRPR